METNVVSIDACTQEVSFILTKEDFVPHFERAYRKAQPTIEIKGFRKGKVPLTIIKQRFGRQIENDCMLDVADVEFKNYTRNNNIRIVGQPELRDMQPAEDGSVTYVIRFDTVPDFELANYEGIAISKPVHTVNDQEVQNIIDEILLKSASNTAADLIEDAMHSVKVRFTKVDDETGKPIDGSQSEENTLFLNHPDLDTFLRDSLIGKKVGESVTYMDTPKGDENPDRFEVTVLSIEKVVPAELNDEFVKAHSSGALSTVAELEQSVRDYNNRMLEDDARKEMEVQIVDKLSSMHDFMVPKAIVHDVMHGMFENLKRQQGPAAADLKLSDMEEVFLPYAEQTARWELIRDKIIEKEGLQIEEQDILPYVQYYRERTKMNDNQIMSFLLKENNLLGTILARKAMDKILSLATITDVDPETYFAERDMATMIDAVADTSEKASSSKAKPAKTSTKSTAAKTTKATGATKAKKAAEETEEKPKRKTKSKSAGE